MKLTEQQFERLVRLSNTAEWQDVQEIISGMIGEQLVATMYIDKADVDAARFMARGLTTFRDEVSNAVGNLEAIRKAQAGAA
jgi:hypothetical protein